MESFDLDVQGRKSGLLLQNKTFVPINGPIFSIRNRSRDRNVRFVQASWNRTGTRIVAGDFHGKIYMFYLQQQRFEMIYQLKTSTFLTFTKDKHQDVLVATSDCQIVSLNSDSKTLKNQFSHHTFSVFHISFGSDGKVVLSCSKEKAILWNLDSFEIIKSLNIKTDVDVVKVFILPINNIIVSAFNDDSVFLWNCVGLKFMTQFTCKHNEDCLNMKVIDASKDEKLLVCAGKSDWFLVWGLLERKVLYTVSLPDKVDAVKQIGFLPGQLVSPDSYILSVLTFAGELHIYNLTNMEHLYKLSSNSGKIISIANSKCHLQVLALTFEGLMELYDLEEFIIAKDEQDAPAFHQIDKPLHRKPLQPHKKKYVRKKKNAVDFSKAKLKSILKNFGEFPENHRFFIWSLLLQLPHNVDAFNILHQDSLELKPFVKDCSFMSPVLQKAFLRQMAMLASWYPVLQEVEYFQSVIYPFVKVLHRNMIECFELLVTYLSCWCQNWFIFCPFQPFNVLCIVENIITYEDRDLMTHFLVHKIPTEIYAWSLLKSSFSEVFSKKEWLKLWDHIFCNSPKFLLYLTAAFSIVIRDALLLCRTTDQFKACYRKHSVSSSVVLIKAYELQIKSSSEIDPEQIMGTFSAIPKGSYPTFFRLTEMKVNFETLNRRRIIDQEIDYLTQRHMALEVKSNYFKELQELQLSRRKLLLEAMQLKDIPALKALDRKLLSIQNLIQGNLTDQIDTLQGTIGRNVFSKDSSKARQFFFQIKDYAKKLQK